MSPSPADPRLRANYKVKTLFLFLFCASGRQMKGQRFLSECRNSRWMFALRSWPRRHEYRSYTLNISSAAVSTSSLPRFPRGWTSANALEQRVGILHSCKPNLFDQICTCADFHIRESSVQDGVSLFVKVTRLEIISAVFESKHDLFLKLTKWLLCLNLTRP